MESTIVKPESYGEPVSFVYGKPSGGSNIKTSLESLYRQRVIIKFDEVTADSDELDIEFSIPFDSDTEANEAELTIYNLSYNTTNQLKNGGKVSVKAGYGNDLGVIFSGTVSDKQITNEASDRVIIIKAIDGAGLSECPAEVSYCAGNTAQSILYDLCMRLGFPIAVFQPIRDYVFERDVNIDGSLMDAIEKYARICGVSAYICKGLLYVHQLSQVGTDPFEISEETGLFSVQEYEKEMKNADYQDICRGWKLEMLLNHRMQTGTKVELLSARAKGIYYVSEGEHVFDGKNMITRLTVLE